MNHIAVRRMALTVASISFSLLTALILIVSAASSESLISVEPVILSDSIVIEPNVSFPYNISCTSLMVENISSYDGPFYEDGSGREVLNTAAILLRNTGKEMVPYAHIILRTKSASYIFDGYMIPPGAAVLIPEKYALPFISQEQIISCFGWSTILPQSDAYDIAVEEVGMGEIKVTNLSDNEISNLKLYHKTYLPENNLYIGGAAFVSRIDCINVGETVVISPKHFVTGYSRIIYYE